MNGGGYTRFPNELLEQIMSYGFNSTQIAILLYVARNTYGWNTSFCDISLSKVARAIGRHKNGVAREIEKLIADNVLYVENEPTYRRPRTVSINPSFDDWSHSPVCHSRVLLSQPSVTHQNVTGESQQSVSGVSHQAVTPESQQSVTHIKKELKKDIKKELKKEPAALFSSEEEEEFNAFLEKRGELMKRGDL